MPTESQYTRKIEAFFRRRGAVTVSEYQEAAGMSRQAAYQWRDRNAWRMAKAGAGRAGADAWLLLGVSPGTTPPVTREPDSGNLMGQLVATAKGAKVNPLPELEAGDTLTVVGIRVEGGRVVVDLAIDGKGRGKKATVAGRLAVALT